MTKPLALIVTLSGLLLLATCAPGQIYFPRVPYPYPYPRQVQPDLDPDASPIEAAGYVTLGGGDAFMDTAGLYGQWNRHGLCPGLDLRLQGNSNYLHGALVGPRLAYKPSGSLNAFHPYIEALFGPNEYPRAPTSSNPNPGSYRGVTRAAVFGLDGDLSPHFRFRLIEFSKETFTGRSGVSPYAITTGIVLHLP